MGFVIILFATGIAGFSGGFGVFAAPVMLGGLGIGYMLIRDAEYDREETTVYFRARDYLLQRLIDTFKSTGDVEAI